MKLLLSARDVSVTYPGRTAPAIDSVSLEINSGDSVGIVGESGSGKSTFARVLAGASPLSSGQMLVDGLPWSEVPRNDRRRQMVQMVFQDPFSALNPWLTPVQTVAEVLRVWNRGSRSEARANAVQLLREVGLQEESFSRRPGQLSGGQCQRVGIARALACDPGVIVADEPTASLDVSAQAQILALLKSLQEQRGLALVFVSHDLNVVRQITDHMIVMLAGKIVESGQTDQLFSRPEHPYTHKLLAASPGRGYLNSGAHVDDRRPA